MESEADTGELATSNALKMMLKKFLPIRMRIMIKNFNDIVGDIIEGFEEVEVKKKLQ